MIEIRLGDRYAKSVLMLAKEKGQLEEVHNDFLLIEETAKQSRDFELMLKSPLIRSDKKQVILDKIFKDKLSKITTLLIEIIVRKGREMYLRDIAIRFLAAYDLEKNITRGVLTSSHPLTADHKAHIRKQVESLFNTTLEIEERIDPELIGGFVLKVGDFLYDGSIASSLRELKQEFDSNPYVKKF